MSEQNKEGPYVYQPFGVQDGRERWESGRIYGVGGLPLLARCDGFTKVEAETIVDALKLLGLIQSSLPKAEGR